MIGETQGIAGMQNINVRTNEHKHGCDSISGGHAIKVQSKDIRLQLCQDRIY